MTDRGEFQLEPGEAWTGSDDQMYRLHRHLGDELRIAPGARCSDVTWGYGYTEIVDWRVDPDTGELVLTMYGG